MEVTPASEEDAHANAILLRSHELLRGDFCAQRRDDPLHPPAEQQARFWQVPIGHVRHVARGDLKAWAEAPWVQVQDLDVAFWPLIEERLLESLGCIIGSAGHSKSSSYRVLSH